MAGRGLERYFAADAYTGHVASEPSTHGRIEVELTGRPSAAYHVMSSGSGVPAIVKRASVSEPYTNNMPSWAMRS